MKKLYFILFLFLSLIITFLILTNSPKNYQIEYKIKDIEILEKYQKTTNDYHFILKYKGIEYPMVIQTKYSKKRKLIQSINIIEDDNDTCLMIYSKNENQTLCSDKNGLKDYHLINKELYKNNFLPMREEKIVDDYEKINIYNNNHNYVIWNYKGYININGTSFEELRLFEKENYSTLNTYQAENYLIVPDYDSKYYFNKIYIFDTEKQLLNDINFDYEISYDLLYLGVVKNKLYFIDKKNKTEYFINLKKFNLKKVKIKNDKIDFYEYKEWIQKNIKDVINKDMTFKYYESYTYKIIDDILYQVIDDKLIKVSNQKITAIISYNNNRIYYLVGTKLYCYSERGEQLLLEYKEWKFNYINQIFIFD